MRLRPARWLMAGVLLAGGASGSPGQVPRADEGTAEIKQALELSSTQVRALADLRAAKATPVPQRTQGFSPASLTAAELRSLAESSKEGIVPSAGALLNDEQREKLAAIDRVMERWKAAAQAIRLGFIAADEWPGTTLCLDPVVEEVIGLGLSREQIAMLEGRYIQGLEAERARRESATDQATATGQLSPSEAAVARGQAIALLNAQQQEKLADFRLELKLVREAAALGLIWHNRGGEVLCR